MQTVQVDLTQSSKAVSYAVSIGRGILKDFPSHCDFKQYSKVAFVADEALKDFTWLRDLLKSAEVSDMNEPVLFFIPAGESSKNINTASKLWADFKQAGLDRKSLVISVGGGAACDLSGFAASTYMRGMDFINIPTTLLSQVDASIGGKTGINFEGIKNLIGTFNQPQAVYIDIETLSTLPERQLNAGFAEIIKHGLIQDEKYYQKVKKGAEKKSDPDFLEEIIAGSCKIKAAIVSKDENEEGLRKILNFGHTFGHAVESLSQLNPNPYEHGEAMSIGMVAEAKLAEFMGYLTHKQVGDIEETLTSYSLPTRLDFEVKFEDIIAKISSDKKNAGKKVNWSLLQKIGKASFDETISKEQIKAALQYVALKS